jgi:hypothetical protein
MACRTGTAARSGACSIAAAAWLAATGAFAQAGGGVPAAAPAMPDATAPAPAAPDAAATHAPDAAAATHAAAAMPAPAATPAPTGASHHHHGILVEEFTADTLDAGETKLGTDVEVGLTPNVMIGTDAVALLLGATTLAAKAQVLDVGEHRVALGVKAAYLSKSTLLWGSVDEHFRKLDARIVRPSISWTNELSPRLKLHTFWAKGFGTIHAELSQKGRRRLWETKHPGADYDARDEQTQAPSTTAHPRAEGEDTDKADGDVNQEKIPTEKSTLTAQSVQVQSITGLAQERFQLTGEFERRSGHKVLVTSRIEQTAIEDLKSQFFRLTAAHQWVFTTFQIRLGVGVQYYVLSGRDLDGEAIDEAGVQPASDIAFYWRL